MKFQDEVKRIKQELTYLGEMLRTEGDFKSVIWLVFYSLSEYFQSTTKQTMNHHYGHLPPHFPPQTPSSTYYHARTMPQPFQVHPQPTTHQPIFMTPPNKTERIMYKSTIQPTTTSKQGGGMGLGRLQNMGRFIRQEQDPSRRTQNTTVFQAPKQHILSFRTQRPQKTKMASSVIFFNKNVQPHPQTFPTTTFTKREQKPSFSSNFQSLLSKARTVKEEETVNSQSPQNQFNNGTMQIGRAFRRQQANIQLESQKVWKSQIMTTSNSVYPQFPVKDIKQLQFSRNNQIKKTPIQNPSIYSNHQGSTEPQQLKQINEVLNKTRQTQQEKGEKKEYAPSMNEPIKQTNSNEFTGMFKKKSPYVASDSGKTDQNLLKMLGIHTKKSPSKDIIKENTLETLISHPQAHFIPIYPHPSTLKDTNKATQNVSNPKKISKSDFKIGKKMGKGQFGEVMLVQHKQTGFICGMKVMNKREIKLQKYQNQIARELSIQFFLNHRNIAPLYGYFQDEENVYLLVEFCTDGQLLEMLRKNRRMDEADVSPIMREICQGLDYIHKEEIIHRDVKPENILFNFGTVKISDFGWAVHSGNGMRKTISGSPLYYSPEIVMETEYNQKIDLWSIGMMTYECLLGKIPFKIYSQLDLNRIVSDEITFPEYVDVSDEAKDFILKIMKKKPEERLQLREMLRHPFITKYPREKKVPHSILQEFKNVLKL